MFDKAHGVATAATASLSEVQTAVETVIDTGQQLCEWSDNNVSSALTFVEQYQTTLQAFVEAIADAIAHNQNGQVTAWKDIHIEHVLPLKQAFRDADFKAQMTQSEASVAITFRALKNVMSLETIDWPTVTNKIAALDIDMLSYLRGNASAVTVTRHSVSPTVDSRSHSDSDSDSDPFLTTVQPLSTTAGFLTTPGLLTTTAVDTSNVGIRTVHLAFLQTATASARNVRRRWDKLAQSLTVLQTLNNDLVRAVRE